MRFGALLLKVMENQIQGNPNWVIYGPIRIVVHEPIQLEEAFEHLLLIYHLKWLYKDHNNNDCKEKSSMIVNGSSLYISHTYLGVTTHISGVIGLSWECSEFAIRT